MARRNNQSASEWIDERCVNFLKHLCDVLEKYPFPETTKQRLQETLNRPLQTPAIRQALCTPGARSQLANTQWAMPVVVSAVKFFNNPEEARTEALNKTLDDIESWLQKGLDFIQEFKQNKDDQKQLLSDLTKICGYIEIFYAPFISSSEFSEGNVSEAST
jgi:hypothetical protein